jgi:uncharacterized protein
MTGTDGLYEWDEDKDAENIKKHGFPLSYAIRIFEDPYVMLIAANPDSITNEERWMALGLVDNYVVSCIYVQRNKKFRIISVHRKIGRLERAYFENLFKTRA